LINRHAFVFNRDIPAMTASRNLALGGSMMQQSAS
jgi:hypothetical protein